MAHGLVNIPRALLECVVRVHTAVCGRLSTRKGCHGFSTSGYREGSVYAGGYRRHRFSPRARRSLATTRVRDLVLIAVLRGAVVFMGDLMRKIELPTNIDFMAVSSYGDGVKSSGIVRIIKDPGYRHPRSRRADRRGHSGLGPDAQVPDEEPREPQARFSGGRRLPCGRTLRTASRPSRPSMLEPIALMPLWWATASTMPSAIVTFHIWAF